MRFSAYVRVQDASPEKVRLLYVGRTKPDGKAAGNWLSIEAYPTNQEWTYLERTFTVPDAQDNLFRIAPALIDGAGGRD